MTETTVREAQTATADEGADAGAECPECIGSGGWFRYEPAAESSPGVLSLSCLQCRGSGRTATAIA